MDPLAALSAAADAVAAPPELRLNAPQEQQPPAVDAPHPPQLHFLAETAAPLPAVSPSMRLASILNAAPLEQPLPPPHVLIPDFPAPPLPLPPPVRDTQLAIALAPLVAVDASPPPPQEMRRAWTEEEKAAVVEGYRVLGGQWADIVQQFVPTRTVKQVQGVYTRWKRKQQEEAAPAAATRRAAAAPTVLDLSADDPIPTPALLLEAQEAEPRRPRRAARSSFKLRDAAPEVIEIHTEESAGELTPQKATRARGPDQRPPLPTAKSSSAQLQVALPPRKKTKLTATLPRRVGPDASPDSPSSSSAASWSSAAAKRGKKRPPVEFEGIPMPAAVALAPSASPFDERACEFCRSKFGVCAIHRCGACKRVYHPRCVVRYYQPHCSREDAPIEARLAALQLNAPPQVKVNMFRCASCLAACIESFRGGVYEADCSCPSCSEPEKLVEYRRRMLFHVMYGGGDLKPARKVKSEGKDAARKANDSTKQSDSTASAAAPAPAAVARRRGRSVASASPSESEPMDVDTEAPTAEASETQNSSRQSASKSTAVENDAVDKSSTQEVGGDEKQRASGGDHALENADRDAGAGVAEPEREEEDGGGGEEKLSDAEILAAVAVSVNDKGVRVFPIVCTESASLTVSGFMKAGQYAYAHRNSPAADVMCCDCCSKTMARKQFVGHTDATFLEMAGKTPSDFLFAAHRDGTIYLPLDAFLQVLKRAAPLSRKPPPSAASRRLANRRRPADGRSEGAPITPEEPPAAIASALQLLESALVVRRGSDPEQPTKPGYLIKVVCVASDLLIRMTNGVVQSKLDPSVPGQAYPYKEGWALLERGGPGSAMAPTRDPVLRCSCCAADMSIDGFIVHTGLAKDFHHASSKHHHVFVPQRDTRALVELDKVWLAVTRLHKTQRLDAFLSSVTDTVHL